MSGMFEFTNAFLTYQFEGNLDNESTGKLQDSTNDDTGTFTNINKGKFWWIVTTINVKKFRFGLFSLPINPRYLKCVFNTGSLLDFLTYVIILLFLIADVENCSTIQQEIFNVSKNDDEHGKGKIEHTGISGKFRYQFNDEINKERNLCVFFKVLKMFKGKPDKELTKRVYCKDMKFNLCSFYVIVIVMSLIYYY